jgi:hypothetical protein
MSTTILYPESVSALRIGNDPRVTITAKGHADGYCKIQIVQSPATIYPPIYMVEGEQCGMIGYFPYTAQKTIPYSTDLDYVEFQMANGTQRIPILDVMKSDGPKPQALAAVADDQVTGLAPNSSDINVAIADAISKLRAKYPGKSINAQLKDSGFVAGGAPVGIAYYWVVMEQQS